MAKPLIIPHIEANHQSIECNFYATMGVNAYAAALASAFTGQFYVTGGLALIGGAAELAYNLAGCTGDPPPPPPSGEDDRFCWKSSTCELIVQRDPPSYGIGVFGDTKALEILEVIKTPFSDLAAEFEIKYIDCNGAQQTLRPNAPGPKDREYSLSTSNCIGNKPSEQPVHSPGEPIAPPQTHTDENGCNWTIQATDAYVDDYGGWHTYYVITADNDACGGPFAYWSSGDEPPQWVPLPPGTDPPVDPVPPGPTPAPEPSPCPDPCPDIPPPHELGAKTYELTGVCEAVEEGQPQPSFKYPVSGGRYEEVLSSKLDSLALMIQQHLALKTPTCNGRPKLEGDWVTAQWISDEASSDSPLRLRKRTRYRSKSGRSDSELAEYFSSFAWEAGPVCVIHKGTWWGTPQVWARDADEGKRVLRHLAGEAGIDPDQNGEWEVSGSRHPRVGRRGTMRLRTIEGFPWVSSRDGSDMLPMG